MVIMKLLGNIQPRLALFGREIASVDDGGLSRMEDLTCEGLTFLACL